MTSFRSPLLEIRKNSGAAALKGGRAADPILLYKGKPLFAFGPMSETSTFAFKLGSKAYDAVFWADWQKEHGMGYVRCYPEQGFGWVDLEAEGRLFPFKQVKPLVYDLEQFDPEYWDNFRAVGKALRDRGIIIHLQFVQVCYFKKAAPEARRWDCCYWNPANNVNEWTKDLEPNFPFPAGNRAARAHWAAYLNKILDAVGDLGNVIFDIGNELNTDMEWVDWTIGIMEDWEERNGIKLVKGLDFTHMNDAAKVLGHPKLDVIMTHGEYIDDAPLLRRLFGKPVVTVISRDLPHGISGRIGYLGLGEEGSTADRFRRFHYRCLMNKVQGVGDYGKMMGGQDPKRANDINSIPKVDPMSEEVRAFAAQSKLLSEFFETISDYEALQTMNDLVLSAPCKAYCLKSNRELLVYLDAGKLALDGAVPAGSIRILLKKNDPLLSGGVQAVLWEPADGKRSGISFAAEPAAVDPNFVVVTVQIPSFRSDLMLHFKC